MLHLQLAVAVQIIRPKSRAPYCPPPHPPPPPPPPPPPFYFILLNENKTTMKTTITVVSRLRWWWRTPTIRPRRINLQIYKTTKLAQQVLPQPLTRRNRKQVRCSRMRSDQSAPIDWKSKHKPLTWKRGVCRIRRGRKMSCSGRLRTLLACSF